MKIRYLIECDCGSVMECEESEFVEEDEYTLSTYVCPKCHRAVNVATDDCSIGFIDDCDDSEGEEDYGEHQEGHILPN